MPDKTVPPQVAQFLTTLRTQPLMKRDFPNSEIISLRPIETRDDKSGDKKTGAVEFTIMCQAAGAKKKGAR